jgi:hypothetical protein
MLLRAFQPQTTGQIKKVTSSERSRPVPACRGGICSSADLSWKCFSERKCGLTPAGWIRRRRYVQIQECLSAVRQSRRVTVAIGRVGRRTLASKRSSGRLRILPNLRLRNSARSCIKRLLRQHTARRRRALVVGYPKGQVVVMALDITRGADLAWSIRNQNSGAIDPRLVRRCSHGIYP